MHRTSTIPNTQIDCLSLKMYTCVDRIFFLHVYLLFILNKPLSLCVLFSTKYPRKCHYLYGKIKLLHKWSGPFTYDVPLCCRQRECCHLFVSMAPLYALKVVSVLHHHPGKFYMQHYIQHNIQKCKQDQMSWHMFERFETS